MRKAALIVTIGVLAVSLLGCKGEEAEPKNQFIGKWMIDYDRSMEEGKKSPKYKPEVEQLFGMLVKNMVEKMKFEVTSDELISSRDDQAQAIAYTVTSISDDEKTMTTSSQVGDTAVEMTFTLIDGEYMNFKSTASDDMDYYIWKRAPEVQE